MSRVLIAGCGDVGNALGRRLTDRADQVWGLRRNTAALAQGIAAIKADLTDPDTLTLLPRHLDAVVYAAAAGSGRAKSTLYIRLQYLCLWSGSWRMGG